MDRFALDSHKLKYHPEEIASFFRGDDVRPIYAEISPTGRCNHKCVFCHYNYLGHTGSFGKGRMTALTQELAAAGVKSLVFAGVGEPLLNKETVPAIEMATSLGIDTAMSTNGALMTDEHMEPLAKNLTWIRFSFNGADAETYGRIHSTSPDDFEKVLANIKKLADTKKRLQAKITIGLQYIVLSDNLKGIDSLARRIKDMGADYFVVKHFYEHEMNSLHCRPITDEEEAALRSTAAGLSSDTFSMVVRSRDNLDRNRVYDKCFGLPFIVYIRENGDVYTCFSYQHDKETVLGNINEASFAEIWASDRKKAAMNHINCDIDKNTCQPNCRHHQINNYLWELKHPTIEHINFI